MLPRVSTEKQMESNNTEQRHQRPQQQMNNSEVNHSHSSVNDRRDTMGTYFLAQQLLNSMKTTMSEYSKEMTVLQQDTCSTIANSISCILEQTRIDIQHKHRQFQEEMKRQSEMVEQLVLSIAEQTKKNEQYEQSVESVTRKVLASSGTIVKLNIGGKKFQTSLATIMRADCDCMLSVMFNNEHRLPLDRDDKGYVFIDRDGTHFNIILNYLREGCDRSILPKQFSVRMELLKEAEFYQIHPLINDLMDETATEQTRISSPASPSCREQRSNSRRKSGTGDIFTRLTNPESFTGMYAARLKPN